MGVHSGFSSSSHFVPLLLSSEVRMKRNKQTEIHTTREGDDFPWHTYTYILNQNIYHHHHHHCLCPRFLFLHKGSGSLDKSLVFILFVPHPWESVFHNSRGILCPLPCGLLSPLPCRPKPQKHWSTATSLLLEYTPDHTADSIVQHLFWDLRWMITWPGFWIEESKKRRKTGKSLGCRIMSRLGFDYQRLESSDMN